MCVAVAMQFVTAVLVLVIANERDARASVRQQCSRELRAGSAASKAFDDSHAGRCGNDDVHTGLVRQRSDVAGETTRRIGACLEGISSVFHGFMPMQ